MSKTIPLTMKREAAKRADFCCEYCLLPESVSFYRFHIDHIRSRKHGGLTILQNLAYCCPDCNFYKGSDVATFRSDSELFTRFFNPRLDVWEEHFYIEQAVIYSKTEIGKATVDIFKFNLPDRIVFRQQIAGLGLYPQ